ncbi:MAG: flagellar biosynthetic protein FliO [Lachnotalea sp.]
MNIALSQSSRFESIWQLFSISIVFIIVLGLAYYSTKWIAAIQKKQVYNKNIEVVETFKVTTNKYIQIVRTGEKYLVIAVSKDTITMLTEIDKDQLEIGNIEGQKENFSDILNKIKELKHKK